MPCMNNPKVSVVGIVYQNNFGQRYYSKYFNTHSHVSKEPFNLESFEGQRKFQKSILEKAKRMNVTALKPQQCEIFSLGEFTILTKCISELQIYLICEQEENYFVMETAIDCIAKTLQMIEKNKYIGKAIYDHLDAIVTITDELFDEGLIVHLDPNVILDRLKMRELGDPSTKKADAKPQQQAANGGGNAFSSFFGFAKSSLQKTLNLG